MPEHVALFEDSTGTEAKRDVCSHARANTDCGLRVILQVCSPSTDQGPFHDREKKSVKKLFDGLD